MNSNKLIFKGEYLNGKRNGIGEEYDNYGQLIFKGEYLNGKRWNGKGYDINNAFAYELKNGKGLVKEYNGNNFGWPTSECEYLNGERNGKGKKYINNYNIIVEGEYLNDKMNGEGKEYYVNTKNVLFEGEYYYDHRLREKGLVRTW